MVPDCLRARIHKSLTLLSFTLLLVAAGACKESPPLPTPSAKWKLRISGLRFEPSVLACAVDETVCDFTEVEIYRERGEWGARTAAGTKTRISVGFHEERFMDVLAGSPAE